MDGTKAPIKVGMQWKIKVLYDKDLANYVRRQFFPYLFEVESVLKSK
jgi:hypothetical protein